MKILSRCFTFLFLAAVLLITFPKLTVSVKEAYDTIKKSSAVTREGQQPNASGKKSGNSQEEKPEDTKSAFNTNRSNSASAVRLVNNQSSILALVNKQFKLQSNYVPKDLTTVKISFSPGTSSEEMKMRKEAAAALEAMFAGAEKSGIKLLGVSGYRSYATQKRIYEDRVKTKGKDYADSYIAFPGHSEHQTGLAMDVGCADISKNLEDDFSSTREGIWVKKNAYKYGFILRYPYGKEYITGYNFEPWHIRYVGKEASKDIHDRGIVFEEY